MDTYSQVMPEMQRETASKLDAMFGVVGGSGSVLNDEPPPGSVVTVLAGVLNVN